MQTDAESLKAYLADRDAECLGCGYNLRGLTAVTCPECGVRLSESRLRAAAASAAAVAAATTKLVRRADIAAGINLAALMAMCCEIILLTNDDPQGGIVLLCPILGLAPAWLTAVVWLSYFRWSPDTRCEAESIFTVMWACGVVGMLIVVITLSMPSF